MPKENKHLPSQDAAGSERSGDRRLSSCSPSSDTPETDLVWENNKNKNPIQLETALCEHAEKLERERNAMRSWILHAAPMLSVASCIVIDEAVERLGEIAGCRAVLESCPVDFINPENA